MLQREVLLTSSKLHALSYEQAMAERRIRTLKSQLRQVCFSNIPLRFLPPVLRIIKVFHARGYRAPCL